MPVFSGVPVGRFLPPFGIPRAATMLTLLGRDSVNTCSRVKRRDFLQAGALGAVGLTLPGYLAARERMFQLSTVALAVRGELASAFGDELLSTDIYLRTWRIHDTAKKMVAAMDINNKSIYNSFCNGINFRIKEIKNDPPIEAIAMYPLAFL